MKIISELTNQTYSSVEDCLEAEAIWKAEQEAQKEAEQVKIREHLARKEELDEAFSALKEARIKYNELLSNYLADYGTYEPANKTSTNTLIEEIFANPFSFFLDK